MGYATTTIVFWGVSLSQEQAKRIFEKHFNNDEEGFLYDKNDTITNEVAYVHREKNVYRHRNIPEMLAGNADSRIHCMSFDLECEEHFIGIYVASKGYAYSDNLTEYITTIGTGKTVENFEKYIQPILNEEGILDKPDLKIVTQVW